MQCIEDKMSKEVREPAVALPFFKFPPRINYNLWASMVFQPNLGILLYGNWLDIVMFYLHFPSLYERFFQLWIEQ